MKKAFSILFLGFYLMSAIGLAVNVHYCQGALSDISFFTLSDNCCCGTNSNDSCCDDEVFIAHSDIDQVIGRTVNTVQQPSTLLSSVTETPEFETLIENTFSSQDFIDPPPNIHLFKKHCAFTFYG